MMRNFSFLAPRQVVSFAGNGQESKKYKLETVVGPIRCVEQKVISSSCSLLFKSQ